eukprot:SAG22_NODE_2518_length_2486_cov_2.823209_1_plen_117_part_00
MKMVYDNEQQVYWSKIDSINETPVEQFKDDDYHKLKKVELVKMIRLERAENASRINFITGDCLIKKIQLKDDLEKISNDIITLRNIIYGEEDRLTFLEQWGLIDEIIKQYPDEYEE